MIDIFGLCGVTLIFEAFLYNVCMSVLPATEILYMSNKFVVMTTYPAHYESVKKGGA